MFNNLKREIEKDFDREKNFNQILEKTNKKKQSYWGYVLATATAVVVLELVLFNTSGIFSKDNLAINPENTIANQEQESKWKVKKVNYNPKIRSVPLTTEVSLAIAKNWESMTTIEKFPRLDYENRHYNGSSNIKIEEGRLQDFLGTITVETYYSEAGSDSRIEANIYSIQNVSEKVSIAVKFGEDENYYIYTNSDYIPETLSDLMNEMNLKENSFLNYINYYEWFDKGELDYNYIEFKDVDDEIVWDMLLNELDNPNLSSDYSEHKKLMGISLNLKSIGIADEIFITVLEDGYVSSNILEKYNLRTYKSFYVGEEKTQKFMDYIMDHYEGYIYVYEEEEQPKEDKIMTIQNTVNAVPQEYSGNYVTNPNTNTTPAYNPTNTTPAYNPSSEAIKRVGVQGDSPEALEYYRQKEGKEQRVLALLKETYGEEIDKIVEKISNEADGKGTFPKSGKELVEKLLDLIEYENITEEDRVAAKELVSEIVYNNLTNDEEIMTRMKKLGIE